MKPIPTLYKPLQSVDIDTKEAFAASIERSDSCAVPAAVFFNLSFLKTLPDKELSSGFAEVIKEALIQDGSFYDWLISFVSSLEELTEEKLMHMIKRVIEIKAAIVAEDEKESGVRAYLNFGHKLGHAIEGLVGYGKISQGEAL
jgi:3-dehydroquinate synthase